MHQITAESHVSLNLKNSRKVVWRNTKLSRHRLPRHVVGVMILQIKTDIIEQRSRLTSVDNFRVLTAHPQALQQREREFSIRRIHLASGVQLGHGLQDFRDRARQRTRSCIFIGQQPGMRWIFGSDNADTHLLFAEQNGHQPDRLPPGGEIPTIRRGKQSVARFEPYRDNLFTRFDLVFIMPDQRYFEPRKIDHMTEQRWLDRPTAHKNPRHSLLAQ